MVVLLRLWGAGRDVPRAASFRKCSKNCLLGIVGGCLAGVNASLLSHPRLVLPRSRGSDPAGIPSPFAFRSGEAEATRHRDLKEEPVPSDETKFLLREEPDPDRLVQRGALDAHPRRRPRCTPGQCRPIGPDDPRPSLPHGPHRPGGEPRRSGSTSPAPCWTSTAPTDPHPSTGPGGSRAYLGTPAPHLLQVRRAVSPAGSHKPKHRNRPGLLQQGGGRAGGWRPRPAPVSGGSALAMGLGLLRP